MNANIIEGYTIQRVWGLVVVNDFFIAGACFGAFLCASLYLIFGLKEYKNTTFFSLIVSFVCLVAIPFNLVDDLRQPARIYQFFINGWGNVLTSPMKWGVILLIVYPLFLIILGFLHFKGKENKKIAILTFCLSFCIPGYTGYILGASVGTSFWNTPVLPLIFIINGAVGGVGLNVLLISIYGKISKVKINLSHFVKLAGFLIVIDIVLRFFWLTFMIGFNKEIKDLYEYTFLARFYEIFILEFILVLIIALNIFTPLKQYILSIIIASICMVVYSYSFKFNIVFAGSAMPKIMSGFLDYSPKLIGHDSISSVLANWLICISLFSLIASFLPLDKFLKGKDNE